MKSSGKKSDPVPPIVSQVLPVETSNAAWRKRLRDEHGKPLPMDGTRIDVTTGQRVERIKK